MAKVSARELAKFLNNHLNIYDYQDYGPNGLQIEGSSEISKIAFAVSAQRDSIEKTVEMGANAMIVHHGLFWKFHGVRTVTGSFAKRVKPLIKNDINLFGYHLPLDAHLEDGNAAGIAKRLGLKDLAPYGDHKGMPTGLQGRFERPLSPSELKDLLKNILNHDIIHSEPNDEKISSMGIITGGANSDWRYCVREGLDAYLTGEMSEHDWHESREEGIHFFAGGHNATERFGVLALKDLIEEKYGIECVFIDSPNPA